MTPTTRYNESGVSLTTFPPSAIAPATPEVANSPSLPPTTSQDLASLAVLGVHSPSSKRNYKREIVAFLDSGLDLSREGVQRYIDRRIKQHSSPSTCKVILASIRLLAREAYQRGLVTRAELASLEDVKGPRVLGSTAGNWLDIESVRDILRAAELRDQGTRDAALIAVLVGCAMRRDECCKLDWAQWQIRDGRRVWIDVRGKGGRVRSIPASSWVERYVEAWHAYSGGLAEGNVFPIKAGMAYYIVKQIAETCGIPHLSPHDIRRTASRLMHSGGAPLAQIQQTLGHSNQATTERYINAGLELRPGKAAVDRIEL